MVAVVSFVFIKKQYNIIESEYSSEFETIYLKLKIKNMFYHFICSYKPPSVNDEEYLKHLENTISLCNPIETIFVVGDLNMDLKSEKGNALNEFLRDFSFKNFVQIIKYIYFMKYIKIVHF